MSRRSAFRFDMHVGAMPARQFRPKTIFWAAPVGMAVALAASGCFTDPSTASKTAGPTQTSPTETGPNAAGTTAAENGNSKIADVATAKESPRENKSPTDRTPSWHGALEGVRSGQSPTLLLTEPATAELFTALQELETKPLDLQLDGGGVDAVGVETIAGLASLEHLRIRHSELTDTDLERISAGCGKLQILNVPQGRFTAKGLQSLKQLPNLRQLRIGGRQIDDAAAEILAELPRLQSLHLIGPAITAAGLEQLSASPKLASLYIDDCPLPDEAWTKLFEAKPKLHVHINQAHHDRDPNPDRH